MGDFHRGTTNPSSREGASRIEAPAPRPTLPPTSKKLDDGLTETKRTIHTTVTAATATPTTTGSPHVKVGPDTRTGASTITQPTTTPVTPAKVIDTPKPALARVETMAPDKVAAMLEAMAADEVNYPKEKGGAAQRKRSAWMAECVAQLAVAVLGRGGLDAKTLTDDYNARQLLVSELVKALPARLGSLKPNRPRFLN